MKETNTTNAELAPVKVGQKIETFQIKDWTIRGRVDEDGHLLITIFHNDGSRVIKTEGLLGLPAGTDKVWGRILTTQKIEEDYCSCPFGKELGLR